MEQMDEIRNVINRNRIPFLNFMDTLLFVEGFPGLSQPVRERVRQKYLNNGSFDANSALIDAIMKVDKFPKKFINFCIKNNCCHELKKIIEQGLSSFERRRAGHRATSSPDHRQTFSGHTADSIRQCSFEDNTNGKADEMVQPETIFKNNLNQNEEPVEEHGVREESSIVESAGDQKWANNLDHNLGGNKASGGSKRMYGEQTEDSSQSSSFYLTELDLINPSNEIDSLKECCHETKLSSESSSSDPSLNSYEMSASDILNIIVPENEIESLKEFKFQVTNKEDSIPNSPSVDNTCNENVVAENFASNLSADDDITVSSAYDKYNSNNNKLDDKPLNNEENVQHISKFNGILGSDEISSQTYVKEFLTDNVVVSFSSLLSMPTLEPMSDQELNFQTLQSPDLLLMSINSTQDQGINDTHNIPSDSAMPENINIESPPVPDNSSEVSATLNSHQIGRLADTQTADSSTADNASSNPQSPKRILNIVHNIGKFLVRHFSNSL